MYDIDLINATEIDVTDPKYNDPRAQLNCWTNLLKFCATPLKKHATHGITAEFFHLIFQAIMQTLLPMVGGRSNTQSFTSWKKFVQLWCYTFSFPTLELKKIKPTKEDINVCSTSISLTQK